MVSRSRVTILVKASPQPSKTHSETVCCAGLEADGTWRRLFPIRFRRLEGEKAFRRWDIVEFDYRKPKDDLRNESCRVHEESLKITGRAKREEERSTLVERALVSSEVEAMERGQSLALIRPAKVNFTARRRSKSELSVISEKFKEQAKQLSLLEGEIASYTPCPFEFKIRYVDGAGSHTKICADWETSAAFFNLRREYGEIGAIEHLEKTYCETYVRKGIVFALGNMKKRPKTWQLLGIFPTQESKQPDLFVR